MSSRDYIFIIYDMVITRHQFDLCSITKNTDQLLTFCVQMYNLLKKWVWMQVESSKLEEITDLFILVAIVKNLNFPLWIWTLLKIWA